MSKFCNYKIMTDMTSDLPIDYYEKNSILYPLEFSYSIDGTEYSKFTDIPITEFYAKMRSGSVTKTAQITPDMYENEFRKVLDEGYDLIYICFSSGLSGSYNSARIASENIKESYPERKIAVIDSLSASAGEGLLVAKTAMMRDKGMGFDDLVNWVENNKLHIIHLFTVDDLMFLHRGGRVSKTSAIAGSILGIKPMLHVDNEGHLIPVSKVRGRKQSLNDLVDRMEKMITNDYDNNLIIIGHGDSPEDAEYVSSLIKKRLGFKNIMINHIGMVVGAHSGPGTMALFFMAEER